MNFCTNTKSIIVGGKSGIGRAVADLLSARPGQVICASRVTGLDISDITAVTDFFVNHGPVDHVVVTAGSQASGGSITDLDFVAAKESFDTKFWGTIAVARAAASQIRPGGTLTFTSGFLSRRTVPGTFVKTAMNAALEVSTKILAMELAPVRVNIVSPGVTETEAYEGMDPETRRKMMEGAAARLPVGRVAQPQDVAAGYLFAIDNPSVTGTVIGIDGGALIN